MVMKITLLGFFIMAVFLPAAIAAPMTSMTLQDDLIIQLAQAGVSRNQDWTSYIEEFDGVPMALVPVGCFMMGSDNGDSDEKPVHEQCFDEPFWIDVYEVTNAQFAEFGGEAGLDSNWTDATRPRENMNWFSARDFCGNRRGNGVRLPTEREWEYAARGVDGLVYPWGDEFDAENVVYDGNSNNQTADVGSRPGGVLWVGALDLSGNVWEWVSSIYTLYEYDATDGREDLDRTNSWRVVRGGSFGYTLDNLRGAFRSWVVAGAASGDLGFRCARSYAP